MITLQCDWCGEEIEVYPSRIKQLEHHFCDQDCFHKWLHEQTKRVCEQCGKEFYARRTSSKYCSNRCKWDAQKKPLREFVCECCGQTFTRDVGKGRADKVRFCGQSCQYKAMRGTANPAWRGGRANYYGPNWEEQRRRARKRDNYTCQRCGATENTIDRELDVHHIIPFKQYDDYEEANRLDNLVTLCHQCHLSIEWHPEAEFCGRSKDAL